MVNGAEASDYFKISRPVIDGAKQCLAVVYTRGLEYFSTETTSYISATRTAAPLDAEGQPKTDARPVIENWRIPAGLPRLCVYQAEDLEVTLLRRSVPASANCRHGFSVAEQRLMRHNEPISRPINRGGPEHAPQISSDGERRWHNHEGRVFRTSGFWHEINRAGLPDDIMPSDEKIFIGREFAIKSNGDRTAMELVLVPDPASKTISLLIKEAQICRDALQRVGSQKIAYPNDPLSVAVPIARLPEGHQQRYGAFMEAIRAERLIVRLTLGDIGSSIGSYIVRQ